LADFREEAAPVVQQPEDSLRSEPAADDRSEAPIERIRVLVVDRHRAVGDALTARLSAEPDVEVVGITHTVERASESVRSRRPALAIVDADSFPYGGVELISTLRRIDRRLPVVAITSQTDSDSVVRLVRAGVSGVALAWSSLQEFLAIVRGVARRESHIPPVLLTPVLLALQQSTPPLSEAQRRLDPLSPREEEVLALMVDGLDRHAIADQLRVSVNTVRTHVRNILSKLDAHSSLEAVSLALMAGERPRPKAS
jgi:DNA-binding NarL/FixJ family response regulator